MNTVFSAASNPFPGFLAFSFRLLLLGLPWTLALEVAVPFTVVALVTVGRGRHRHATPIHGCVRRLARELVDMHVCDCGPYARESGRTVAVPAFPHEVVFFGKGPNNVVHPKPVSRPLSKGSWWGKHRTLFAQ